MGHGKTTLFDKLCTGDVDEHLDVFMDTEATKDDVIRAGICLFKYIYNAPNVSLAQTRFDLFSKKAAAGVIRPETLPPTEGAAAQHSLRAYLQTRDWLLLKSMSLDVEEFGWVLGTQGYMPVPTLEEWAPEKLRNLTSCNCKGDCTSRKCGCVKNAVNCISACGHCRGVSCKNTKDYAGEQGDAD